MHATTLETRRASIGDLDVLLPLFLGYLAFYQRDHPADAVGNFLADRIGNGQSVVFLALLDGRAVGFTQLYPSFASLALKPGWILNDLFVEQAQRGRGVARALMACALQLARETGAREIFLQTARSNASAQRLYESLDYVRDDDFLVYTLNVPTP